MATAEGGEAFGAPGDAPRWTTANKTGVGTAYSISSRIWFTLAEGVVTEVYWPTVDRPQTRDLQFLVSDGATFLHEERAHLHTATERLDPGALGYRVVNSDPDGRYAIEKEIIADPHYPCILQRVVLRGNGRLPLRLFVLCAPHLNVSGIHNHARIVEVAGRRILTAHADGVCLALAATRPFARASCGFVGRSDGWTDLADNFELDWQFDRATDGNVALVGELPQPDEPIVVGLGFGNSQHAAVTRLLQSLDTPFDEQRTRFLAQWKRITHHVLPLDRASGDAGALYASSYRLLMAHEDKTYPGALIASLSIPWGDAHGDEAAGGYHLVWTRDLVNSVLGLLAAGNTETPRRALVYLAASQQGDGGFAQNAWIDGVPYWTGIQLDEVAFPILLARRLAIDGALREFDPYPLVMRAAAYLVTMGPATEQDRWEEASGYSPSTLASNIAALVAAANFAREHGDELTEDFLLDYADFLEQHVETWTVTTEGTLVPGVPRHYMRVRPVAVDDPAPDENPNSGELVLANVPPGERFRYPAKEIVDAGFLELVRYGIRRPDDPIVVDSLRVVDALLRVDTPRGPAWRRYTHDGYGQRADGGPYDGYGVGRAWPLLTGERGHYELAAGRDPLPYITALERFAGTTGLLPEQVWDVDDLPEHHLFRGHPTGAARPLMWAHAEYIKLLRSAVDGRPFDWMPEVAERYGTPGARGGIEIWKTNRRAATVRAGVTLRILDGRPFRLHWSSDSWRTPRDVEATRTPLGIWFVDLAVDPSQVEPLVFTFLWTSTGTWEGRDYSVAVTR